MYENAEYIRDLIVKHIHEEITPAEKDQLEQWIQASDKNKQLFDELTALPSLYEKLTAYDRYKAEKEIVWEKIDREPGGRLAFLKSGWVKYAAAVVMVISTIVYFLARTNKPIPQTPVVVKSFQSDAKPNTSHAFLTLDNGKTVVLDSITTGLLATQGGTKVMRQDNGALRYSTEGKVTGDKLIYNTLTVPKGSDVVYMQLSDGSKVWLNAESSIRYPVSFNGEERQVEMTGEAYFEVAKLSGTRFVVSKGSMNIVVLGTKFNVNTYENEENIKVTLLEGSVKVQSERSEMIIKPGQQAVVNDTKINIENDVDLEQVMAWKEGKFVFNNTDLEVIMRQIERWYGVDVKYEGDVRLQDIALTGRISRYSNASKVLDLLQATGVLHFTIDGKKITVRSSDLQ